MTGNAFNTWESHLHKAVFGMNATRQASTCYSPFYLAQDRQTVHHAMRIKVEPTATADADGATPASEQAPLEPGSRVYMMQPGRHKGWEDPHKLIELNGPNATLEDGTAKRRRVHINRLAKVPSQPPHAWYLGSSYGSSA
jgi:hypothetical protein